MDAQALLDEANACHDADPARGADLLLRIDPQALDTGQRPLYGYLLNHVLGEKLGDWAQANHHLTALLALPDPSPAVLRHAAVAASLAGDPSAAERTEALAASAAVSLRQADELVTLAGVALLAASLPAAAAGQRALAALAVLDSPHWQQASSLDIPAAAQCNNLGSALVERPLADLADARLCQAMTLAAVCSQQLWQRIGTWVHDERALYLRALVASALGHATEALAHAEAGLALIDAHDSADEQTVDRAFLSLEAAFALQRLGRRDEAAKHHACADRLAAGFGDSGLQTWFADRAARNQLLSR